MKALVTGGSGFIGSEVIRKLIEQGISVRAFLRTTSSRKNLEGLLFEEAIGHLSDLNSLKDAVKGVDLIFHLAGSVTAKNEEEFFKHNALGTSLLAQACSESGSKIKRFVYVSSLAAAGPAHEIKPEKDEKDPVSPVSSYGRSKLAGEQGLLKWAKDPRNPFSTTVIRPPVVYGPRDKGVFEFIKIVNSGFMPIFPAYNHTGEKFYSVIHVEDLVSAVVQAGLAENQQTHEVFHVSGDGIHSWSDILSGVAQSLNKKPMRLKLPRIAWKGLASFYTVANYVLKKDFPLTLSKFSEMEQDFWTCSNEKAKQTLSFQPKFTLQEGMKKTIDWYQQNGWL